MSERSIIKRKSRTSFYLLVLIGLSFLWLPGAHAEIKLSFGLYASDKPTTLVRQFRPILNDLEKELSQSLHTPVKIKLSIAPNYTQGLADLVNGQVDFSRFGPASYVEVKEKEPGVQLLVMESKNGKKQFNGAIIVHSNSEINTISQLKGRSFAFGNKRSTIGRYLSQNFLVEHGIYANDLSAYDYLDRHDQVGFAVAQGKFHAGAIKESTLELLIRKGQDLKAIATFKNVTKPWIARKGLEPRIFSALQNALLNFRDKDALKAINKDGFLSASDSDYHSVRMAITNNKKFFTGK
ncbi:MAG: PhnD/SsuA/transferrin family substrate-binding protein [Gammaproteobacteria bacterium]|nr:PhnD/SsuA/transferrin family substrate-binding protein [Gammaproteobacteria bacterium]